MFPFVTKRLAPCAGTPVHTLTCGHTIHASFLHPTTSSKCAPNCKDVNMVTKFESSFLCPTCYETTLRANYNEFVDRCKKQAKKVGIDVEVIVVEVKKDYEHGVQGAKKDFDRWWDVFMKYTTFKKMGRENYKWKMGAERLRGCKAVETDEAE